MVMRRITFILPLVFSISLCRGQGTFDYDQQSADESVGGGAFGAISSNQPIGQSFTPTLPSVGFIRVQLADSVPANGVGATVCINLRQGSITGAILGSSNPVSMTNGFGISEQGYV